MRRRREKFKDKIASGKLALVVADTLPVQIDLMKKGLSAGQVGQRPFEMGYKVDVCAPGHEGRASPRRPIRPTPASMSARRRLPTPASAAASSAQKAQSRTAGAGPIAGPFSFRRPCYAAAWVGELKPGVC